MATLVYIQNEMIQYGMSIYFVLGIFGNICNCIIFTRPNYRRTASSIYFISFSIFAIIYLLWSIIPYFYTLHHTDPSLESLFYCKIRLYITHVSGQYIRFCIVFSSIDRFLATRTEARIRSLNSPASAKKMIFIMCIICPIIAIHLPILNDIQNNVCGQFGIYRLIYAIYQLFIIGIIPPVLMSVFSILTIVSLYRRHGDRERARQRDRYLTRMVIVEVVLNVLTTLPYSAVLIYGAVTHFTVKTIERIQIEAFIYFVASFQIYLISVIPFYLFLMTAKPFRSEFINLMKNYIVRKVHIAPAID